MSDEPYMHGASTEAEPESLRELTEEEVVAAARAFWLDDLCEQRDEEDDLPLLWEH